MNIEIFKNALFYYYSGEVHLKEETSDAIYFEVDGEKITFSYGWGYLDIFCTCKHCSIKSKFFPLCSRKLACLFYLEHKVNRKKKNKNVKQTGKE